ncbi:MAG: MFS transporter, partial [Chloroflexi bacterium]|nr:MFS transporter [Chloroflexota bacterium]
MISDLVGEKHLLNAISLNAAAHNASRGVGPAIAGLVINAFGVGISYFIQAAIYLMATVWTVQIKLPATIPHAGPAEVEKQDFLRSALEGLSHITTHRMVLALMVLGLAPAVLGMPFLSLMPVFAIDVFEGDAGTQGLLLSMVGIGSVVGSLAMASFGGQGRGKTLIVAATVFSLSLVAFSQSPVLLIAAAFALMAGFTHSSYTTQNQTILQMITPREIRGRVLGVYMLDRGLTPLGSLLAGALAALMGGPWAVTIMGVSCLLLTLAVGVLVPTVRKLELAAK